MSMFQSPVVVAKTFMTSMAELRDEHKLAANQFVMTFRQDPDTFEYCFDSVPDALDPNLRTSRVAQDTHAVVFRPDTGNAHILLWIGPKDAAFAWSRTRRCSIHPDTGAVQVFALEDYDQAALSTSTELAKEREPSEALDEATDVPLGLFDGFSGEQLRRLGVPVELMYRVRHMQGIESLEEAAWQLPADAYDSLFQLALETPYDTVFREVEGTTQVTKDVVDTEDYATALDTKTSRAEFHVVENEEELLRMMNEPLATWRTYMHRSQTRLAEGDHSGPTRVLGGAGTGKTVVAMHRAIWLARHRFTHPDDRVLFTTFTKNLAADIEENLRHLAPNDPEVLRRIEVVHLDKWVHTFLKRQKFPRDILYFHNTRSAQLRDLWDTARDSIQPSLSFSPTFCREEWEEVIQANGIATKREYLRVPRAGRGSPLPRSSRIALWEVFATYRDNMADDGVCEREDAIRAARALLEEAGDILPYKAVVVDEAQDMSNEAFKLIRQIVPTGAGESRSNDIFIVGDGHQRIYNHKVVLGRCGIEIRGRAHRLKINYRTTAQIQKLAISVLEGHVIDDLNEGEDTLTGYRSLTTGQPPEIRVHPSFDQELETIITWLGDARAQRTTCLVCRTHGQLERYDQALKARGIPTYTLSRQHAEQFDKPGVRLATMHRVKGLEFERVVLAGIDHDIVPLATSLRDTEDEAVREARELQERALFYVACSRAKRDVLVTTSGRPSVFLDAVSPS